MSSATPQGNRKDPLLPDNPYAGISIAAPASQHRDSPRRQREKQSESEREFQQHIIGAAEQLGWRCYHATAAKDGAPGFPDLVLAHPTRGIVFAELQTNRGKPSPEQQDWLLVLRAAAQLTNGGVQVRIWKPDDLNDILSVLGHGNPS